MNRITIIGNLTRDPELRTTSNGIPVCSMTIAVNRRRRAQEAQETDYFNVTTWRQMAESCAQYLTKGKRVAVSGAVSMRTYEGRDGRLHATLEIQAEEVEFLTPRSTNTCDEPSHDYTE